MTTPTNHPETKITRNDKPVTYDYCGFCGNEWVSSLFNSCPSCTPEFLMVDSDFFEGDDDEPFLKNYVVTVIDGDTTETTRYNEKELYHAIGMIKGILPIDIPDNGELPGLIWNLYESKDDLFDVNTPTEEIEYLTKISLLVAANLHKPEEFNKAVTSKLGIMDRAVEWVKNHTLLETFFISFSIGFILSGAFRLLTWII